MLGKQLQALSALNVDESHDFTVTDINIDLYLNYNDCKNKTKIIKTHTHTQGYHKQVE